MSTPRQFLASDPSSKISFTQELFHFVMFSLSVSLSESLLNESENASLLISN